MSKVDAAKFVLQCQNWAEVAIPIATHKIPRRLILRNGMRFESHSLCWPDIYAIFFQGIYTPQYLPIEKNDVVVDIGANIGAFSVYAASKTQNTVYAIEPSLDNFQALNWNISSNRYKNIVPLNFAVSDQSGEELFLNSVASQHRRVKKFAQDTTEGYTAVPSITLQDLMDSYQIEQIDFLKLDCEGAEEAILTSTSSRYLSRVRKIAMEFHDHLTQLNHNELQKLLKNAGFSTNIEWDDQSVLGFIYAWRN